MAKKNPRNPILSKIRAASRDEGKAVEFIEAGRWGDDPACPKCGSVDVYQMRDRKTGEREKNYRWRCRDCKKMYSVRTGTVFEETRLPLSVWLHALWRACSSKKGVSALQISRECEISYKSALFLMHRIRFMMHDGSPPPLSGTVEVDETYVAGKPRYRKPTRGRPKGWSKPMVFAMVERGGNVRAMHMTEVNAANLRAKIVEAVDPSSRVITDEAPYYKRVKEHFQHETVNHRSHEYVRKGTDVTTNTIEGFFSLIKRGVYGTFHSVSKEHLHRYVSEFEFRYNTRHLDDGERTLEALRGGEGKRLMYRDSPPV